MQPNNISFKRFILLSALLFMSLTGVATADTWRGTAPFCSGHCLKGEEQISSSDYGDGGYCVTGHKVLCRNTAPMCKGKETQTHCYGVVMMCDNGYHESLNGNWHSCNTYACGACLGISSVSPGLSTSTTCKSGYVWREAIKGDYVCVPPATRTQAAGDNAQAGARRAAGSDTCKSGYVWREVVPADHVCVTPQIRSAVAQDNGLAAGRVAN